MWWEEPGHLDVEQNKLYFAGHAVDELVDRHGTPTYFYNLTKSQDKLTHFKDALETSNLDGFAIKYAVKANNNTELLERFETQNIGIDATSPNELHLAQDCGFSDSEIVFTGTSLSNQDLDAFAQTDVLINFDSVSSLRRFNGDPGRPVGLRINSGVGLGRHAKTTTGGEAAEDESPTGSDSDTTNQKGIPVKFGIPHDDSQLFSAAFDTIEKRGYELSCIHHHVGSGWLGDQALKAERNYLTALEHTLKVVDKAQQRGHEISILDLGGGFGVPHSHEEDPLPLVEFFDAISDLISDRGLEFSEIFVEPGTYLVSEAGIFVTKVTTVETKHGYTFVGVDAGLNSFNSFANYEYYHEIVNCNSVKGDGDGMVVTVAGNNCESGDLFAIERPIETTIQEGDYLALLNAGAYGAVFKHNFNLREPASEIVVS